MNKILITTAIDYTNDVIHIGHAYQKIMADCLARFYRLALDENSVFFLTGTDEYGTTNETAAKKANKNPKVFIDEISAKDKEQLASLNISFNRFIRTTDKDHHLTVKAFYQKVLAGGDIYKGYYEGLYCNGCEAYRTLTELVNGQCAIHPTKEIIKIKEENYFFRWSKYQSFLKNYIEKNQQFILPLSKRQEMLVFLKKGLQDIPISRPKFKVSWGIPVPDDDTQVIYVWFDALINYYTAASPKGFWDEKTKIIHIIGKDNLRWHALLWPAMLKSAGVIPHGYGKGGVTSPFCRGGVTSPLHSIYAHSFINLNGQKISKSLGNVIRPSELVKQFGSDAVRYFFLKYGPLVDDVDISIEQIKKIYNSELANDWGNLVSRVAKLCGQQIIGSKNFCSLRLSESTAKYLHFFQIPDALEEISKRICQINQFINQEEPWKKKKEELEKILTSAVFQIRQIAFDLQPFMPETSAKILKQFQPNVEIKSAKPYFPRIV